MTRTEKALALINKEGATVRQLENLLVNIRNENKISDEDKELLIEAVSVKIKRCYPSKARSIFGNKNVEAIELLTRAHDYLSYKKYDWSKNQLKNGVKVGGDMIAGASYISYYISFKSYLKKGCAMSYVQEKVESMPQLRVKRYEVIGNKTGVSEEFEFEVVDYEHAVALYETYLSSLLASSE